MNHFQDMSSNRFQTSSQPRAQPNRFRSGPRFKDQFRQTTSSTRIFPESNSSNNNSKVVKIIWGIIMLMSSSLHLVIR